MSIDVKKLLYKYPKLIVAMANIQKSIERLSKEYPSCTPRYSDEIQARGGLPQSQTERLAIFNVEDIDQKREQLMWDAGAYMDAINLVTTALHTLNLRQQEVITKRYFEDKEPIAVSLEMNISIAHFYQLHRLALGGIEQCLNNGNIVINSLVPTKNNKKYNSNRVIKALKSVV